MNFKKLIRSVCTEYIEDKQRVLTRSAFSVLINNISSSLISPISSQLMQVLQLEDDYAIREVLYNLDPKAYINNSYINDDDDSDPISRYALKNNIMYPIFSPKLKSIIIVSTYDRFILSSGLPIASIHATPRTRRNSLILYIYGPRSADIATAIYSTINGLYENDLEDFSTATDTVVTYQYSWDKENKSMNKKIIGCKLTKSINAIYTNQQNKTKLINYITKWTNANNIFKALGITYKLGILLYGPPGTGKTSMAKAIAAYFNYQLVIIDMSTFCPEMAHAISADENGKNMAYLLEDIDYIFGKREQDRTPEEKASGQAILQMLDGANSASNKIFIATTNFVESLDPALVRDGRFDLKIHMDNLTQPEAIEMVNSMKTEEGQNFDDIISSLEYPVNPAHLQNIIIQHIFEHLGDDLCSASNNISHDKKAETASSDLIECVIDGIASKIGTF